MIFDLLLVRSATLSVSGTSPEATEWLQAELPAADPVSDAREAGFSEQATRQALPSILMERRVRIDGLEETGSFLERYVREHRDWLAGGLQERVMVDRVGSELLGGWE